MNLILLRAQLRGLSAFRSLLDTPMLKDALQLLDAAARRDGEGALAAYDQMFYRLKAEGYSGLGTWLWDTLRYTETPYGDLAGSGRSDPELEEAARDLNDCGIEGILSQNIQRDALMKFSVVSPMAACGIYHDIQVGGMQAPGQPREDFKALVAEIGALAQAMGYPFPEDPVVRNLAIQDALDPDASTSLKRDLDAGKPSEVDGLIFEVVRLGRKHHVPTPMYDRVAAKLGYSPEESA